MLLIPRRKRRTWESQERRRRHDLILSLLRAYLLNTLCDTVAAVDEHQTLDAIPGAQDTQAQSFRWIL